jgi:arsenite methyltransferase
MSARSDVRACCAATYADPAVQWLLGDALHPGGLYLTDQLLRGLSLDRASTLFDLACGLGTSVLRAVDTYGCRAIGIDLTEELVIAARAAARQAGLEDQAEFVVGDAERLPLIDEGVDAVLCECALCLFSDPERALSEANRVLRPGGRLALSDVTANQARLPASLRTLAGRVVCLGGARPLPDTARLVVAAGFDLISLNDASQTLQSMLDAIDQRLAIARMARRRLPDSLRDRLDEASAMVADARTARRDRTLGYGLILAEKPRSFSDGSGRPKAWLR